jgi:hypothetical protein
LFFSFLKPHFFHEVSFHPVESREEELQRKAEDEKKRAEEEQPLRSWEFNHEKWWFFTNEYLGFEPRFS